MKMWSGRFEKQTDTMTDEFNASLPFDIKLYKFDIQASIAHAKMLNKIGILSNEELSKIHDGLCEIKSDIENEKLQPYGEDVHMFIEAELTKRHGDVGKKLHTARSRNDQVATDFRLYIRNAIDDVLKAIKDFQSAIIRIASENLDTIMCGYTHMQRAQPITLAHHFMAYAEMLKRDFERLSDCKKRVNILPLGSGALATTTYKIDRQYVAELLSFNDICQNSLDGVSDRDFVVEYVFCLSLLSAHLSRLAEEIILWNSSEFSFVELDDAFSTGSSIMPQKKNPDICELIRAKSGSIYGNLVQLLTILKGLPLAYNKDLQEDKEQVFVSTDTVIKSLNIFGRMLSTCKFNKQNLRQACDRGFTNATDVADYLAKKGVPFRDAHEICGKIVLDCIKNNKSIQDMTLKDFSKYSCFFKEDILDCVKIENVVKSRNVVGGPESQTVKNHIKKIAEFFSIKI